MKKVKMRLKTRKEYPSFYEICMSFGFDYRTDLGHVYEKDGLTVKGKRVGFTSLPTQDVSKVAKALLEWKQARFSNEKQPTDLIPEETCDVAKTLILEGLLVFNDPSEAPAPRAFPLRPKKTVLIDMTASDKPVRLKDLNEVPTKNHILDHARARLLAEFDHAGIYYEKSPFSIATEDVLYLFNLRMTKKNRKYYDEVVLVDVEMKNLTELKVHRWHAMMIDRLFQMSVSSTNVKTYYLWNDQAMTVDVIQKHVGQQKPTLAFESKAEVLAHVSDLYGKRLKESKHREESLKNALAKERKDRRHLERLIETATEACLS